MTEPAGQIKSTQAGIVLLVEDEQIVADIYQLGLGRAGYEVLVANSGPTGLELAETGRAQSSQSVISITDARHASGYRRFAVPVRIQYAAAFNHRVSLGVVSYSERAV